MPKRALISVSDKSGVADFAKRLQAQGWQILSTGGTADVIREAGVEVTDVSDVTQFPECFGGRVKTMHPLIMGGVLMRRGQDDADAKKLGIENDITFLRSISDGVKRLLLREVASVVVYTPTNEHFGIVPVEAMACKKPVVAVNLGGPLESVGTDGRCGILTDPTPEKFAKAFTELYDAGLVKRNVMGENGKNRVTELFTIEAFSKSLCGLLKELVL